MFDLIQRLLRPPEAAPLPDLDARRAVAALLVRVARSDHDYAAIEQATIDAVLAERYGLGLSEAQALRAEAEAIEAEAPDTVRFTRAVKDHVPYEDRSAVIAALWRVILSDQDRHHAEDGFMRLVANLLGIEDRDSALIRQAVAKEFP